MSPTPPRGLHAIQCRINAEDPEKNFQPSPGRIAFYYAPGGRGVRIDSHAYTGYVVPPYYDSMIAKLITVGATRASAIARMRRALDEYYITGIKTTVPFHSAIMRNADFQNGTYDTGFVERVMNSDNFEIETDADPVARISRALTAADLDRCRLYGILDLSYVECSEAEAIAGQMIDGGVDLIQLRAKERPSAEIAKIAADTTRLHIAEREFRSLSTITLRLRGLCQRKASMSGRTIFPSPKSREIAGPNCMVGKSTHSVDQAIRAFYEGADYIGFGPIFATPTKPDYPPIGLEEIQKVHEAVHIPIFCIGGIKLDNLPEVIEAGARRVVIVSGLLQAKDIATYGRAAKELLNRKSQILNPQILNVCPHRWFHRARYRQDSSGRTRRLARRFGFLCRSRCELFFAGQTRRHRRRRFSGLGIRILEIAQD